MSTCNWKNRTMWTGDNLDIMRGMNSESVDLIYLDPPFNSNRTYSAPIGSQAAGAAFKDTWTLSDVDNAWHGEIADRQPDLYSIIDASGHSHGKGMKSYLIMMAVRLLEMRRVLKATGSLYLHCDPTASHYLKLLMDAVFGMGRFRNEIVWHYRRWTGKAKRFQRLHDLILFYGKTNDQIFNVLYEPYTPKSFERKQYHHTRIKDGDVYVTSVDERGVRAGDVWPIAVLNSQAKERVGYPTQKPIKLLDRIIKASSNEGDMILAGISVLPAPDGTFIHPIAADRTKTSIVAQSLSFKGLHLSPRRRATDWNPCFSGISQTPLHTCAPCHRRAGFVALQAARQPAGTGSAQILRSMSPNSRRVRCPSASRSQ